MKNYIVKLVVIVLLSSGLVAQEKKEEIVALSLKVKSFLPNLLDLADKNDEDEVLKELFVAGSSFYQGVIEVVALYYCAEIVVEVEVLYDQKLFEISKDALRIMRLLSLYVPLLCNNEKTSILTKSRKLALVGCVMTVAVLWLRAAWKYQVNKHA